VTVNSDLPYRLSHVLEGHLSDVKAVCTSLIDDQIELLHSASRDETCRSWYRGKESIDTFSRGSSYAGKRYQNAVAFLDSKSRTGNGENRGTTDLQFCSMR
jgi:hypothetical protein